MQPSLTIKSPCGHILTAEQARTILSRLAVSKRPNHNGGRAPTCQCGECRTCRVRRYVAAHKARHKVERLPGIASPCGCQLTEAQARTVVARLASVSWRVSAG